MPFISMWFSFASYVLLKVSLLPLASLKLASLISGQNASRLIDSLPESMAKKTVLGMKVFYKVVIKDLQKKLLVEDVLLMALTHLNPWEQKPAASVEHSRVVPSHMP